MPVQLSCKIPVTGLPTQSTKPIKRSVGARFCVILRASHCQRHCFQKCCKQLGAVLFNPAASENKTILDLRSGVSSALCHLSRGARERNLTSRQLSDGSADSRDLGNLPKTLLGEPTIPVWHLTRSHTALVPLARLVSSSPMALLT